MGLWWQPKRSKILRGEIKQLEWLTIEHAPHTAGKEQNKAEINWWRPHSGGMTVYLKREKNIQLLCYNSLWHWAFGHLSHKPENQQQPEQAQQITFCIPHQHNWGQKVKWVQNATILNLICPISIILMATKGGRQQGITFTVHFKSSSWQINGVLYKKKKKKISYIGQALEWLQGQDLLFWLNLLQALGIS